MLYVMDARRSGSQASAGSVWSATTMTSAPVATWMENTVLSTSLRGWTLPSMLSYRWISWHFLPWELKGITSPCCLLIGQYPHHMTLCPPVAIVKRCSAIFTVIRWSVLTSVPLETSTWLSLGATGNEWEQNGTEMEKGNIIFYSFEV